MIHPYTRLFILPAPPDADNDETEGYEVGDVVHVTGGSVYDCRDATEGAAVWDERGAGGGALSDLTDVNLDDLVDAVLLLWSEDDLEWQVIPSSFFAFSGHTHSGPELQPNANDIFRCDSAGVSAFAGTIATLPGGAVLTYNVTSGQENVMVPTSTSQLAKMRLYNTTRGTSALISNCVIGTNTITLTANVPAGWATTDVITIASQTVNGTGVGLNFIDLEITSGEYVGKSLVFLYMFMSDTGGAGQLIAAHPFETFGISKLTASVMTQSVQVIVGTHPFKLTSNIISLSWGASGAATASVGIRQSAYLK